MYLPVVQETAELIVPSLGEACARQAPRLTLSSLPHSSYALWGLLPEGVFSSQRFLSL